MQAAMGTKTRITVEEFAQMSMSETEDYELVDGELVPLASGTPLHAKIRQNVEFLARTYFDKHRDGMILAEVDCRLTPHLSRRPDLSIFLAPSIEKIDFSRIPVPLAPDIVVEVLSPSESAIDVHRKALEYLSAGSQEVWQLDHQNGEIFVQTNTGIRLLRAPQMLESPLLPGFSAAVDTLLSGF